MRLVSEWRCKGVHWRCVVWFTVVASHLKKQARKQAHKEALAKAEQEVCVCGYVLVCDGDSEYSILHTSIGLTFAGERGH